MRVSENKLPQFYLIILFILSGVFLYWGFIQLESLLSRIALIIIQLFKLSVIFYAIVLYLFEGAIIATLIYLIVKVVRISRDKKIFSNSNFSLDRYRFKRLGFTVLLITATNLLLTFITKNRFETDMMTYVEQNLDVVELKMLYFGIINSLIDLSRKILLFVLYFLIVYKLLDRENTKANNAYSK